MEIRVEVVGIMVVVCRQLLKRMRGVIENVMRKDKQQCVAWTVLMNEHL